jgi:hypothetical protein
MAHLLGTVVAYEALHVHLDLHVYLLATPRVTASLPERSGRWFPVPATEKDI